MAEILTEAFTGDIIEIQMREKELRQQEMLQDAFQDVLIPINKLSDEISSLQFPVKEMSGTDRSRKNTITDGGEVSPF